MMPRETGMTLTSERIGELRKWLSERGRSQNTAKAYCGDLLTFMEATGSPTVTADELEELAMAWLQMNRNKIAPATTIRRLTSLKAWCNYAGIKALEEYSGPQALKTMPHPLPGGIEDVFKLLRVCHLQEHEALVAQCGLMGMRVGEAISSRASNFNLTDMTIKTGLKRERLRIVPVSSHAWSVLQMPVTRSFINDDALVVGIKDRYARQLITNLGIRAGITRHISSHDLRSTFATQVYADTKDIRLVQELLGHDSVTTTQLYTDVALKTARKAVEF